MKTANHSKSSNSGFASSHGVRPKILIVEDEAPVAMVIRFLLNQAGCETEIATDIPEALQLVDEKDFSLITLDVGMPGGGGFSLCKRLKQDPRLKQIPIVIVSGRGSLEDQQHGCPGSA